MAVRAGRHICCRRRSQQSQCAETHDRSRQPSRRRRHQHRAPFAGAFEFDPITLERGITFDPEFEKWANLVYSTEGDGAVSLANFRKDIMIELLNLQGTIVKRYQCVPLLGVGVHRSAGTGCERQRDRL